VFFEPDHAPDAEQEVAFDDDQVRVIDSSTNFSVSEASRLRDGRTATGLVPPPPPPPQEPINKVTVITTKDLFTKESISKIPAQILCISNRVTYKNNPVERRSPALTYEGLIFGGA
tara:strand:- start:216 stop:563 length:348 start_codon:yes stop_codon:yes gene_type:complete